LFSFRRSGALCFVALTLFGVIFAPLGLAFFAGFASLLLFFAGVVLAIRENCARI
jgi:predicted cation transporter